ncbi:hypothetical protein DFS34DRAFT_673171 [Phlyctochytrium arcticum]|nr:hypothetical protein DFS34DRAFT_673171 [Phlyctochytrium arcticum]
MLLRKLKTVSPPSTQEEMEAHIRISRSELLPVLEDFHVFQRSPPHAVPRHGFRFRDSGVRGYHSVHALVELAQVVEELAAFRGKTLVLHRYKSIRAIVLRKNVFTDRLYRDDEFVIGWELGNELGGWFGMPTTEWILEMSAYIKYLDAKHLVFDGPIAVEGDL